MSKAFANVRNDVIKVSAMFIVTAVLSGKSLTDKAWQTELMNTLIGFAAFELVIARFFDPSMFGKTYTKAVADIAKVGTMLVVTRVLSGGSLQDQAWMMSSGATLAGFTVYNLFVANMIKTGHLKGDAKQIADDWLKVGTMLVVSHVLKGGDPTDAKFLQSSVNTIVGFNAGDLLDGDALTKLR